MLKALIAAIIFWLNSRLTHEHSCQQLWPATLLPGNIVFFLFCFVFCFSSAWLQHVIDFVSFAIPRHHCRQYCLIRLPDYSSREWKENGGWEGWGGENNDNAEISEKCSRMELFQKYITSLWYSSGAEASTAWEIAYKVHECLCVCVCVGATWSHLLSRVRTLQINQITQRSLCN